MNVQMLEVRDAYFKDPRGREEEEEKGERSKYAFINGLYLQAAQYSVLRKLRLM